MTREELMSWRKQRGLNQAELGKLIGMSRQAIIHWERGHHAIPDDIHIKLMRVPGEIVMGEREGRITPAAFPHLYRYQRDIARFVPNDHHPNTLARYGLFGWHGLTWAYANVSDCPQAKAEALETAEYEQALANLTAGRMHPGVEAIKRWLAKGETMPGVEIRHGAPWPTMALNDAVKPWEGFNYVRPEGYPSDATLPVGCAILMRAPLPAGYYWTPDNQLVCREEVD
jgi:DNA-binding XRE family transcriptional regulator